MIHYDILLQNATDIITKCDSYFIIKCDKSLLQNASSFSLQNVTVLSQNATVITNCDDFITRCDSYYKMRRLLHEAGIKNNKRYFLPRGEINNYIVLIDGRNFYDQSINDLIKQYDEVRKISTRNGDDYTTGCLFDYAYFKDNYRPIAVDLSKQKVLDGDPRAIQQIVFQVVVGGADNTKIRLYTILEKSKETVLEFYKGTAKVL